MLKPLGIAFATLCIVGCGSGKPSKFHLRQLNIDCINGKIAGEYLVKLNSGEFKKIYASNTQDLAFKLQSIPNYSAVDYNFRLSTKSKSSSTPTSVTPHQANLGPNSINANFLWQKGYYGQGVKISLIDSGFDVNGHLLKHAILENPFELGNDEDRNGYLNDRFGWNTLKNKPLTGDTGVHGTLVGSVIVASHKDGVHIGVAPQSKIIPVAALKPGADAVTDAAGDSNSVIKALDYSVARGAEIINASWGGENCSSHIQRKIQQVTDKGVVFVTSSGNDGVNIDENIKFPASSPIDKVLTVGALNDLGQIFFDSNYGSVVDFFALGQDVVAVSPGDNFALVNGSSVATPYVSGGLALLKSAFNEASYSEIIKALKQTSRGETKKTPDLEAAFLKLKESFEPTLL